MVLTGRSPRTFGKIIDLTGRSQRYVMISTSTICFVYFFLWRILRNGGNSMEGSCKQNTCRYQHLSRNIGSRRSLRKVPEEQQRSLANLAVSCHFIICQFHPIIGRYWNHAASASDAAEAHQFIADFGRIRVFKDRRTKLSAETANSLNQGMCPSSRQAPDLQHSSVTAKLRESINCGRQDQTFAYPDVD